MSSFQFNGANYSSARAAGFAHAAGQRRAAEKRRRAGRQLAHDSAASSRGAEKRAQKRHEIVNRPRGRTEAIGHRADGSPIYRAIPAFRTRPYTPPSDRKERPEPTIAVVNGWRYNVRPTAERIAAALKAEAPQREHWLAAARSEHDDDKRLAMVKRGMHNEMRRAARKIRAARIRRQGW